jgi:amidase
MPFVTKPWMLDATGQVSLVASRQVSCRELVEAQLAQIERLNPVLGAATVILHESALMSADAADRRGVGGPLRGLPFTVKEDIDCLGSATTHGVPSLRNALPYLDAPIVARLKAAGAIPIARTNLSEMGLRLCTINPLHGRTLSPYDRRLTVGGSSGGDAVAVCTGMSPVGIGGDLGGSLRVPAACCGCVSLKPTTGRVAHRLFAPARGLRTPNTVDARCRSVGALRRGPAPVARCNLRERHTRSALGGRCARGDSAE